MLLRIHQLRVNFETENATVHALKGVDIDVDRGEIVAIVGESGSGKSVTSMSIMQLLPKPPAAYAGGEILFCPNETTNINLLQTNAQQMRQLRGKSIAMIFQEPMTSLNPVFTCGDQVIEAILVHEKTSKTAAKAKALEWFKKVKLPDPEGMLDRYPHQLSGGQKQRVMIAMALCCQPDLLICDEPTTALDVRVQKTILELIQSLQQELNMGVIFITHDLGVVAEIADRVVVMYKGEVVESGVAKTLFHQPQHAYTKGLLACRPALHPKGQRLPVVSDFLQPDNSDKNLLQQFQPNISDQKLIEVKNLSVHFPNKKNWLGKALSVVKAVDDVSFDIYKGETLGVVGESGCGKTTLGRSLLRLIEPSSGSILLEGKNFLQYTEKELRSQRKNVQIVFQDPYSSLNPRLSIGNAIVEPMMVHGLFANKKQGIEKAVDLLEKVNLQADHFKRYPHEFSGGQRQRIVIARALALNPDFIVFDESVSALDVSVQAQVLNLLNELKTEFGFTAVFISHDLSVVRYISDRILVMQHGRIVEMDDAEKIYNSPQAAYTRQLLDAIPKIV
jgi:peptide/nickel transport system ATP-binding protein